VNLFPTIAVNGARVISSAIALSCWTCWDYPPKKLHHIGIIKEKLKF
jgi:hypothetical protein